MVACGDADGAVTGNTRRFGSSLEKIKQVVSARTGEIMFGLNLVVHKGKTIFVGDTSVHEYPSSEQLSEMAISAARVVRLFGFDPKVAFVSHSTFGQPLTSRTKHIKKAVDILITSQLRSAMIFNKNIKATNYQIDTYKKKIYVYGIALTSDEKDLVISEAKEILDVENVIASIIIVDDLRIQKD